MSHISKQKTKLLNRVKRLKGQVEAIERALENESGCSDVLHLIAATRGAVNGLMSEVIEDHIQEHVGAADLSPSGRAEGTQELIDVLRTYLR